MKDFIQLPSDEQRVYYEQASAKLNLPVPAVEKDFWVCWTLSKLFNLPDWKNHLTFKGGTSLSKVWNLIKRFSEDIDVTVSRSFLGFDGDADPEAAGTRSQKEARIKRLKQAARDRVMGELASLLQDIVVNNLPNGSAGQIILDETDTDNCTVLFHYPRATLDESLGNMLPYVKIEMGPRGDNWPAHSHTITPYLETGLPGTLSMDGGIIVNVLDAERTFVEKAMLLHEDTFRPTHRPRKPRMARHYYDLYCLIDAGIGVRAINDINLFTRVREHRQFYYPVSWVDYSTMVPGSMRIVPKETAIAEWAADYNAMRDVFFFDVAPPFEQIMNTLQVFENELNHGKSDIGS